jgi:hypothetical protein
MTAVTPTTADGRRWARSISRSGKIQLAVLGVNIVFWGAILGWTVLADHPEGGPDRLDDRSFPAAAESVCADARADIDELGLDPIAESPLERAEVVDVVNERLREMVASLRELPRPEGEQGEWVARWIDDWETHIADRQLWADRLRAGEDVPFTETDRAGVQLSRVVDRFAEVNDMPNCITGGDV